MISNLKYTIPGILVLVIVFMQLTHCSDQRNWNKERKLYVLNDSLLQKKILDIRDSSGRELTTYSIQSITTNQLLASKSQEALQLKADLVKVNAKIKNVLNSASIPSTTEDSSDIAIDSVIYIKDTGNKDIPFIYTPDKYLSIRGITHLHIGTDSIYVLGHEIKDSIANSTTVAFYNRTKFLQRQKMEALITQDNPHTTTGKVQVYYIQPERKWFEKWYTHAAVGAITTLFLVHLIK